MLRFDGSQKNDVAGTVDEAGRQKCAAAREDKSTFCMRIYLKEGDRVGLLLGHATDSGIL